MSEPDAPEDEKPQAPYFPPPRRARASPYRATLPRPLDDPPPGSARLVVVRAPRPDQEWPRLVVPPAPLSLLDRLGTVGVGLRALGVFVGNHPVLCAAIVLVVLGGYVAGCGRQIFGGSFVGRLAVAREAPDPPSVLL